MQDKILEVKNLRQHFKVGSGSNKMVVKAVDGISFDIYKGEVFALVGESGCGKTTTGRSIIKLYDATEGEVYFHGTRIIADVKKAKLNHKLNLENYASQLASGKLDKETYDQKVAESAAELELAKRDRHFEKRIDEEGLKAKKQIESLPQYQDILNKYANIDSQLKKEFDAATDRKNLAENALAQAKESKNDKAIEEAKVDLIYANNEYVRASKELKLKELRKKQDIANLKYRLINKNRTLMRKMQMIFQDPIASLNPRMTVKEIIAEGLRINGFKNEKEIDDRVKNALEIVGLVAEHASRYSHEFSGGQRQRIGIARALVVEPSLIIADEPISALDVSIRAQVINLLNDLREQKGITILFIAHDLSVVKYFCDRLAVMYFGKIVEVGDKNKIFNNPLHPYTLALLSSIPLPDPTYEKSRKRTVRYNPATAHDYSIDKPELREVEPGHFVLCNEAEFKVFKQKMGQ